MSFDLNCSDFLVLKCNDFFGKRTFLLDTQADISLIKHYAINENTFVDDSNTIKIRGVTKGIIETYGIVQTDILINNNTIPQEFHVVSDDFGIPSDGIIGRDFIKRHKCIIDYDNMALTFWINGNSISFKIYDSIDSDTVILPPRSEVFRIFKIDNFKEPQYIPNLEIANGIFSSSTFAFNNTAIIRVMNTHNETKTISNIISNTENLSNYYVYTFDTTTNSENRTEQLAKIIKQNSPEHIQPELLNLCTKYSDIFSLESDKLTQNNFYKQKLRLTDNVPIYTKNYRLPQSQKSEIDKHVKKLIDNDLIEPSMSPYNSPVLLVPEKSTGEIKQWRMVIDYRQLNRKLIADKYPLPRIDEILDGLGNAKYFSILDLYSGFHQITLDENSREYTAFTSDQGTFQWKVLPFGLNVAPNSFCRMMALAFAGVPPERSFMYMDDIIVIGKSENNHLENLEKIFDTCKRYNLKLNPTKCSFFRPEVSFLGHNCTQDGVLPDNSKVHTIQHYPKPTDKDSVRRFSAMTNYYRKFIPNYAEIVQPLNKLTRKNIHFEWSDTCENSFQTLKSKHRKF